MKRHGPHFLGGGRADTQAPDSEGWVRSQNLRIIDRIRNAVGLGNQSAYSVGVAPSVQPVLAIESDAVPPLQYRGDTFIHSGAGGAGNRSEIYVAVATGFFPPGGLLEVYLTILATVASQVIEMRSNIAISGATNQPVPYSDLRTGTNGGIACSTKNSAAATGGGNPFGNNLAFGVQTAPLGPIGPFLLTDISGMRNLMIRPTTDNQAVSCLISWRILFKAI